VQGWVDQHPVLFSIADVVFLLLTVSFLISWWSGWALLARRFPERNMYTGQRSWGQSGEMRWMCGYRRVLVVGANSEGLYLATLPFFPLFHPALFIPWAEIYVTDRSSVVFGSVRLELGNDFRLPLTLSGTVADDLRKAAGSAWSVKSLG
jgi:hypothetical protein